MKSAKSYLDDANKLVEKVSTEEAVALHGQGGVFVDVRDSADISTTGTIAGAVRIPRGFIEFAADEATPFHNKSLRKDADIYLVCGGKGLAGRLRSSGVLPSPQGELKFCPLGKIGSIVCLRRGS